MSYAIRAEGLVKRYGDMVALDGVDLEVPAGKVIGVLGPNGAGKTTTVRILSTLMRPDAGRATAGGFDVVRDPAAPVHDANTGLLTVPVADPMLVSALVRRLDGAGIAADEPGLRLPSPDEVFLALPPDRPPRDGRFRTTSVRLSGGRAVTPVSPGTRRPLLKA